MNIGTEKNIKIFKTATQVSIMDVKSALDYHKEKDNEMSYRGSIVFLINEYGRSKNVLQSFLPKSKCKMICNMIINGSFVNMFPVNEGFVEYGGSAYKKIARTLRITFELNQGDFSKSRYVFQIDEGEGIVGKNGQISMKRGQKPKSVRTYVNIFQAIEMAHEILDFIQHQEIISLMKDKPLYTWDTYQPKNTQNNGQVNNQQYEQQTNNQPFNNNFQQQQPMNNQAVGQPVDANNMQYDYNQYGTPPPTGRGW